MPAIEPGIRSIADAPHPRHRPTPALHQAQPYQRRMLAKKSRILIAAAAIFAAHAHAESTAPAPVPERLPYDIPYGPPITLAQARTVIAAAEAEALHRNWKYAVVIVDSGGNLISCDKMDGTQLASVEIAEAKARASVRFRRPTKDMQNAINHGGATGNLSIPGILAGEGGIPIVIGGQLIGAIGTSGGAGVQDSVIAAAGAAAIK
ncbi:GlcG/HbpS family heme-binding protein [Burkholderia anthina]|uniref:GlcG/HbpS family heme-binding protein n=2 Tax=Burkholderia anthina TaxID=179879 RepID=UPI001FC8CD02|nr:heme-binding protein [Burkholderia anthina]